MCTGLKDGGEAVLKSTVSIQHGFKAEDGIDYIRLITTHHVVERPTFDILIGKGTLKDWEASLSFSRRRQETMVIDGGIRISTFDMQGAVQVVEEIGDQQTRNSEIWRHLGTCATTHSSIRTNKEERGSIMCAPRRPRVIFSVATTVKARTGLTPWGRTGTGGIRAGGREGRKEDRKIFCL